MRSINRYIITGIITAISLFLMWYFSDVLSYILISAVLSLVGKPLVDLLSKIKFFGYTVPRWASATVALVVMWGITVLLLWFLVPIVVEKIYVISELNISDSLASFKNKIDNFGQLLTEKLPVQSGEIRSISSSITQKITEYITPTLVGLRSIFDKTLYIIVGAFSVSFITFFFLKESELFKGGVMMLFPIKYEENADRAITSSISLLSRYFIGILIESTIKLIIITVSLMLFTGLTLGDSVIIALISAILNVVPYIGPLIGAGAGIIIGVASPEMIASEDLVLEIVKMMVIFGIFQLIDNIVIQPYVYSSSVKAHPLEIFIVILIAGSIAGVMGMLLAIPAYTVIRVFAKEFFIRFRVVQKLTEKI